MIVDWLGTAQRGIQTGSIYALIAVGISLTYRASKVFNFTQATFVMTGAVVGVILWQGVGLPLAIAFLLSVAAASATGMVVERVVIRPVMGQPNPQWIVSTFGALIAFSSLYAIILLNTGSKRDIRRMPDLTTLSVRRLGSMVFSPTRLLPVAVLVVTVIGLTLWQRHTDYGRALGAVADNKDAAALRGIPVHRVALVTFAIAGAIGGICGFIAAPLTQASTYGALDLAVKGFVANAIGGMQSIRGAIVGGVVLGLLEHIVADYIGGGLQTTAILVAYLLVLVARPEGLMSRRLRTV